MNDNITISAVLPSYNSSKFSENILSSVSHQPILPNELYIIDDGSEDRIVECVSLFKLEHPEHYIN